MAPIFAIKRIVDVAASSMFILSTSLPMHFQHTYTAHSHYPLIEKRMLDQKTLIFEFSVIFFRCWFCFRRRVPTTSSRSHFFSILSQNDQRSSRGLFGVFTSITTSSRPSSSHLPQLPSRPSSSAPQVFHASSLWRVNSATFSLNTANHLIKSLVLSCR